MMLKSPLSIYTGRREAKQVIETASGLSPERVWTLLQPGVKERSDSTLTESWLRERARQPHVHTWQ